MSDRPAPDPTPDWFDADRDVLLTPRELADLAHPVRMRLLSLLREEGPATSTLLARRCGQSTGVTSYHLRVLAEKGFVVEDAERGDRRDRWWRAAHRYTVFTFRDPSDPGDPETIATSARYVRLSVAESYERMLAYVDTLESRQDELAGLPYTFAGVPLRLTTEQAFALRSTIEDVMRPYLHDGRDGEPAPDGTLDVVLQLQLLPVDPRAALGARDPEEHGGRS